MLKSFAITTVAAVVLVTSGTAAAEITKINVGPTLNPFFLRLVCNRVAGERGGRFIRSERSGPNKNGICYIDIPKRNSGIVATPGAVRPVQPQPVQQQPVQRPVQQQPLQGTIRQPVQQTTPGSSDNTEMVNVGRLWSQPHAEERCKAIAASKKTTWTGLWKKHDSRGEAQCQLRKKPDFVIKAVSTDKIWGDSHARYKCPQVAKAQGGVWAGNWQVDPQNENKARCMVKMKIVPMVVQAFVTTKIWNDAHAKKHCTQLAQQNKGQWQGEWRNTQDGRNSVCMIKLPENLAKQAAPTQNNTQAATQTQQPATQRSTAQSTPIWDQNLRDVKAGEIWDQAHAGRKCPVVARNAKGSWTGKWNKVGSGNEAVCQVRFGGGIVAQATRPTATTAAATPSQEAVTNSRTRNVAAGPIWDEKQAAKKCPVVAANNKAKWTGNWTKTGPGHISVCEISVAVAVAPRPQATQKPIVINVGSSSKREVPVGGIWDQAQAVKKCPLAAKNNKGTWTGKWRKISTTNAVCEIEIK